jgi:hypothetical protein
MIRRCSVVLSTLLGIAAILTPSAAAAPEDFGLESVEATLSAPPDSPYAATQAGAHPDLTLTFAVEQDPASKPNSFGLRDSYAATRNIRFDVPSGFIGDPNVLGTPQQCPAAELARGVAAECPNGSQVGVTKIFAYELNRALVEPVYMMAPPGGDVVARLGFVAGTFPTFVDFKVRSESDYGLVAEIDNASAEARLIKAETTTWGVPADSSHDIERCTPGEVFLDGCIVSEPRPPGSLPLPFLTNPTRCGVQLEMRVSASSWVEPDRFDTEPSAFPQITGCNRLPFRPGLSMKSTSSKAASPTGVEVAIKLPASDGVDVLEPSQVRDIRVALPEGFAFNPSAGDGLETCSVDQVRFGTREASQCPDAAKLADTEFDIPVLERNLRGAIYLREPEPGHPFRIWITADDLGLHVKLSGELDVDEQTGQITEVTTDIPQAPVREARLVFKSGFRAPLVTPDRCGTYSTEYEFVPWSGGPPVRSSAPMTISEGCDTGGFSPKLRAGTVNPAAGAHSPFVFTLTRNDGEQNPAALAITMPAGLAATFRGIPRCEGADAATGRCPAASKIGHVDAAVGAGPAPLWVPQAGKRPTAVYLGGPYKGGPLSIVAVVPKQAGPFDFGDEVVRSAIYVDPATVQATIESDPLPQLIEGIPIGYRALHVAADRQSFILNPTGCRAKQVTATVTFSSAGAVASPSTPFAAANCSSLGFEPRLAFRLIGGTRRGAHPALRATFRPRAGDANPSSILVRLPRSAFLDQSHIETICTRVQFAAKACPQASIYGKASATSPLIDEKLEGNVYLRSSDHELPDLVVSLQGPPSLPVEINVAGRVDSVNGGIRTTFEDVPDAPVTEFRLEMQGGRKGLLINSRNLCRSVNRATVELEGQNGKRLQSRPAMRNSCKGAKQKRR